MPTPPTLARYLALFHELYPTREITSLTADAWMIALHDVDDLRFSWAADRVLKEQGRTFFPTPNELRSHLAGTLPTRRIDGPALEDGEQPVTHDELPADVREEWNRIKASLKGGEQ